MSPEVLIYIGNIKKFLDTNQEAHEYFLKNVNEEDFFSKVAISSQKNFEKNGDPMLLRNEFEEIKNELLKSSNEKKNDSIFMDLKDFGTICLN
jgi:hypothetical protein